ncbi:MAG: hypothetical protein PHV34_01695 [Verrucomicrobiae bacterium]|nr:hypothetical protein [Verrucomicrobiae bacterium]
MKKRRLIYNWDGFDISHLCDYPTSVRAVAGKREESSVELKDRYCYMAHEIWLPVWRPDEAIWQKIIFRVTDDLASNSNARAKLVFKLTHVVSDDEIKIRINGQEIPVAKIEKEAFPKDRDAPKRPPYWQYSILLDGGVARMGINELSIFVAHSTKGHNHDAISICEVEVIVEYSA